tara:strand:- start:159 stop:596 length:438 start_codon:yes stop_codon:yes gene_type:complete
MADMNENSDASKRKSDRSSQSAEIHSFPSSSSARSTSSVPGVKSNHKQVTFNRAELEAILRIYGFKVAGGEWRDYAIDHLKDRAVFSIFRRSSEMPMFYVEKDPALARKQGMYKVVAASGHILKRGHELPQVLKVLEKPLKVVSK